MTDHIDPAPVLRPHGHWHRRRRAGVAARRSLAAEATAARGFRTSPRRPSGSSTCISPAGRRRSTCSTTSRSSNKLHGTELPGSIRDGPADHRHDLRPEDASRSRLDLQVRAARQAGAWVSELLPHTAKIVDDIAIIRSA